MLRPATLTHNKRANWLGQRYQQLLTALNQHDYETFETIYDSTASHLKTAYRAAQQLTLPLPVKPTHKPPVTIQPELF